MTEEERTINYKNNLFKLAINMYMVGDFIGHNYKYGNISNLNKITLDDSIKEMSKIEPTEKSEVPVLFATFSDLFNAVTDWSKFINNWCLYVSEKVTNISDPSFLSFVALVKKMRKKEKIDLNKIYTTSKINNLYDNGCLSLVYPVYNFVINQKLNLNQGLKLNLDICKLTHYNTLAMGSTSLLYCIIDNALTFKTDIFNPSSYLKYGEILSNNSYIIPWLADFLNSDIHLSQKNFIKMYDDNTDACKTLLCAMYYVKHSTDMNDTISLVLAGGGDVGSILPLSLMLSTLYNTSRANYFGAAVDVAPLNIPQDVMN